MYSAQDWFDNFYNKFIQARQHDQNFGVKTSRQDYTKLMMKWLEDVGREQGFRVTRERLRIDQLWKHESKGTIALEHEIKERGIYKNELPKLMDISSNLKVLITYVYDYQFPWETDIISNRIEKQINEKYTGKFDDFLLVIGTRTKPSKEKTQTFTQRESDWYARRFTLQVVKREILIPSASRAARAAWDSRRADK